MCATEIDPSSGKITIYSLPNCMACKMTAKQLEKAGLDIEVVDLAQAPEALEAFKAQGIKQAPVVQTPQGEQWSGLRTDKIKQTIQQNTQQSSPER